MKRKKKYDGSDKIQKHLYFDDFISDVNYFNDISLKRTIYFFIKNKESNVNKLSELSSLLFTIDNDDNDPVLYFQKKTVIGFMLVSDNYYNFMNLLENEIDKEPLLSYKPPNKWANDVKFPLPYTYTIIRNFVKDFVDENIDVPSITQIYKEYFCLNYRTLPYKNITGIKCEDKKPIIEKQIYEELIIKLSYFVYFYMQIKNKNAAKFIINHYILHFIKSNIYNISLVLDNTKKYSKKEISLYNIFNDTDENIQFKILRYLPQFKYKDKIFSTCGETTLLNILNYCLINTDGTFNTEKILNEDVKNFYDGKKMSDINKSTMPEWLDIVSNLNFTHIYNTSGDIHNNVKNVACVLNKLVYDKDSCDISDSGKFIVQTLEYISNDKITIKTEKVTEHSLSMIINNNYSLFFKPGHGEMYNTEKTYLENINYIKTIDLNNYRNKDEFDIIYTIYKKAVTSVDEYGDGEKMDYDESISKIAQTYFADVLHNDMVKLFLLNNVNSIIVSDPDIIDSFTKEKINAFLDNVPNIKSFKFTYIIDENIDILEYFIKKIPKYCHNVESFEVYASEITEIDLTPLKNLNLIDLDIHDVFLPHNFKITTLKKLNYYYFDTSVSIKFIKNLTNLDELYTNLTNLNTIANLKLKKLQIYHIKESIDIKPIKNIKSLEDLSLSCGYFNGGKKYKLENGEIIDELINLQKISFDRIDLTDFPLELIVNLPSLLFLQISDCIIDNSIVLNVYNKNINEQILKKLDEIGIKYNFVDKKPSYVVRLRAENGVKVKYRINAFKKMESVFNSFSLQTGIDKNDVMFYINGNEVNPKDTIKSFGYEDIIINVVSKKSSSSSRRKSSSPRTTKKLSSPRTTRKLSSPRTTRKSSSPKTTRKLSSPKTIRKLSSPRTTRKST
jgi:hypothetical protein